MTKFQEKVYNIVKTIKSGQTMTYAQVADLIGQPKSVRAVGNALNRNYNHEIPCHRVVKSDGSAGGYNRGIKNKIKILKEEGITKYDL